MATSFTTEALGTTVVSFLGPGERWTDLLVGDGSTEPGMEAFMLSEITAEVVLPEPSAYPALVSLGAFTCAAFRRRPRRSQFYR